MPRIVTVLAFVISILGGAIAAHEGHSSAADEIKQALVGRTVVYDTGTSQSFFASGKTLYVSGQSSWGNWTVRDGQYCSQWPPSPDWACYRVHIHGDRIEFIGQSGDVTAGTRQ